MVQEEMMLPVKFRPGIVQSTPEAWVYYIFGISGEVNEKPLGMALHGGKGKGGAVGAIRGLAVSHRSNRRTLATENLGNFI